MFAGGHQARAGRGEHCGADEDGRRDHPDAGAGAGRAVPHADRPHPQLLGHAEDDTSMAGSQPGQYKTWPLGGATRRAAILESVVRVLSRLVNLLANESSEIDQADDKNIPANESVETDKAVVKNGEDN